MSCKDNFRSIVECGQRLEDINWQNGKWEIEWKRLQNSMNTILVKSTHMYLGAQKSI